jgi:hypothetical protein
MTDKLPPREEYRIDSALVAGIVAGTGAAVGPALGVVTEHLLNDQTDSEPAPQVVLPPGVNPDSE